MCALIASVTLIACTYTPLKETGRDRDTVTITWLTEDVDRECYMQLGREAWGCAVWRDDWCMIRARVPDGADDSANMEILGHEMLHCFRGGFH